MYPDHHLVKKCLQRIEEILHWGPSGEWHNEVFVELSERIQQSTQVLLSPTTLKRVWGRVHYKSAPSITTLNTLAMFAGYQNWRDFKGKAAVKRSSPLLQRVRSNFGIIILGASLMTVVFISFYSLREPKGNVASIDLSEIVFTSRPVGKGLPNSVIFDLNLGELASDSMFIQQYWDPTKTIRLGPGQKQATGQYYYPGYFRAKLLVDGTVIKEHDLFIASDGWLGTLDYEPVPKYLKRADVVNGRLAFSPSVLEEIKRNEEPIASTFHLVDRFKAISGDHFVLNTSIKNTYREKWAVCQKAAIIILGTRSSMIVSFSIPGCVSEIGVMMSDVYLSGKKHDLSGLGVDLTDFREVNIKVSERQVEVHLEDQLIFTGSYNQSIGDIAGIRYRFLGAGEVSYIKLSDLSGHRLAIDEDFK